MTDTAQRESAGSSYYPVGVTSRYGRPAGKLDPDKSLPWLRRVLPILKGHQAAFLTFIALSLASSVLQILAPNIIKDATTLIGHYLVSRSPSKVVPSITGYAIELVVIGLLAGVTGLVSRYYMYRTAYDIEFDLRNHIYEHLSVMSFGFYDRVQSGQLISRANSDIRSVQMYTTFAPLILVQCMIGVVAFAFMAYYSLELSLIALAMMPFLYVIGVRMRRLMFPISWVIQARLAGVAAVVDENVNGVRVVKAFAQEDAELHKLADAAKKVEWAYIKDADIRGQFTPWVQNLPQVGLAIVLGVGGWLVVNGDLNVGEMLAFNLYFGMLQAPFMMLGQLVMMGQRARASAERIFEILDERSEIVERPDAVDLEGVTGRVSFRHVGFHYATGPAIFDDLNIEIEPGEVVAIVGETGTGKSTVARLLTRFYDVTEGSVEIDGHDVRDARSGRCARASGSSRTSRSSSRCPSATTSPTGARTPRWTTCRRRPLPPTPTSSSCASPRGTTPWSASAATRCRVGSASASPSHAPCCSTHRSSSSTTPPARSTSTSNKRSMRRSTPCSSTARRSSSRTGSRPSRSRAA